MIGAGLLDVVPEGVEEVREGRVVVSDDGEGESEGVAEGLTVGVAVGR